MAKEEVYIVKRRRRMMEHYADIPGAMQGSLYIFTTMEEKYLPSLKTGNKVLDEDGHYKSRLWCCLDESKKEQANELWRLPWREDVPEDEKIVFISGGDYIYTAYKDLPRVAQAYRNVEFSNDHMKAYADILDKIYKEFTEKDIIGVYNLGTSVISISDTIAEYCKSDRYCERPHMKAEAVSLMDCLSKGPDSF